jgi:hypothetical protein
VYILYRAVHVEKHFLPLGLIIHHYFPNSKEELRTFVNDDTITFFLFSFVNLNWAPKTQSGSKVATTL